MYHRNMSWMVAGWLAVMGLPAWAGPEEEAIRHTIVQTTQAIVDFSTTRDRQSVLGLYAKDYGGIQDGEAESLDAVHAWLEEYEAQLQQGSPVRYAGEISDLRIRVSGATAWATYRYVFQMLNAGQSQGEDRGLCTNILQKEAAGWVVQHEHCSKTRGPKSGR
ncbi:MAG: nuclear transport factor 2 family protein [Nitrospirae bacterium]|nr:nuclear transport factor 2 family protein [Nitrospirota bacterium]